ncbi:MAG: hypothetical protein WC091_21010 [Sulfuricellaceae bacterium]
MGTIKLCPPYPAVARILRHPMLQPVQMIAPAPQTLPLDVALQQAVAHH